MDWPPKKFATSLLERHGASAGQARRRRQGRELLVRSSRQLRVVTLRSPQELDASTSRPMLLPDLVAGPSQIRAHLLRHVPDVSIQPRGALLLKQVRVADPVLGGIEPEGFDIDLSARTGTACQVSRDTSKPYRIIVVRLISMSLHNRPAYDPSSSGETEPSDHAASLCQS